MEEIIKDILEADKQARRRVKEKQQERLNIQNLIQQQDEAIKQKYRLETQAALKAKKAALDEQLLAEKAQEEQAYEATLQQLQATYDAHKDEWVNDIVQRCISS